MSCIFHPAEPAKAESTQQSKYMTTVRMGPRGQIVIPKEARELFDLRPGDNLLLLADGNRGLALLPGSGAEEFFSLFDSHFPQRETS